MSGDFSSSMDGGYDGGGGGGGGGGLGSLADELADAWDEEGEEDVSGYQDGNEDQQTMDQELQSEVESVYADSTKDRGGGTPGASQDSSGDERGMLSPIKHKMKTGRHKRQESHYDGSDYGNNSDLEEPGDISPGLETRMSWIESLARRGTEENGSSADHVVNRVIESLRDLGGQSGIENGATRYVQ